jgi:hypothetical protein
MFEASRCVLIEKDRQMKQTQYEFPTVLSRDSLVPLESVLCTEDLNRRTTRPPDYEAENRVLVSLVQELAESPRTILQALADKILEVFDAGSAGVSLLTKEDGGKRFYWPAIVGVWKPHIGGGTPRDFSPCGDVLDRNTPLMFRHLERRYTYFLEVTPPVEECLLVPFMPRVKRSARSGPSSTMTAVSSMRRTCGSLSVWAGLHPLLTRR